MTAMRSLFCWLAVAALLACSSGGGTPLRVDAIQPSFSTAGVDTPVAIIGSYVPVMRLSYSDPERSFADSAFSARVGLRELWGTRYESAAALSATVPGDLIAGVYDLVVRAPDGQRAALVGAFTVTSAGGGDGTPGGDVDPGDGNNGDTGPGGEGGPGDRARGDSTPGDRATGDSAPGDSAPGDSAPGDSAPGDSAPGDSTPGDSAPGDSNTGDAVPGPPAVQTGVEIAGTTDLIITVPLTPPVDPTSHLLVFSFAHQSLDPVDGLITAQIVGNGAAVEFSRNGTGTTGEIAWSVIELPDVAIDRGSEPLAAAVDRITLPRMIDPARSFSLTSMRSDGSGYDLNDWPVVRMDATGLDVIRGQACCNVVMEWQLVELSPSANGAVQHGELPFIVGQSVATATLPVAAPLDRSFLTFTHGVNENEPGNNTVANHAVRGQLSDSTTVTLTREGTDLTGSAPWSVVTLDALFVQHGTTAFMSSDTEIRVTLPSAVQSERSFALSPSLQREGSSPFITDDAIGLAWFALTLADMGATLVLRRGDTGAPATVHWSVVELR